MKKSILLFAGLLLASASQAQITLNSTSYPVSVIGTDSLEVTATNPSGLPSLSAATNAMWDLSTITDSALEYAYRVAPDTTVCEFADSITYYFSTYSYEGNVQSSITSGGLMEYGVFIPASTITVSGGVASINVLAQHSVFSSPYTVIQFPATMGDNWSSNYQLNFNVLVTAALLGYTTPTAGAITSNITETDTVVGWGKMRIKSTSGSPSLYFDVLQVKTKNTVIDTFSGSLANSTLLGAISATNPDTTITYTQNYYRTNEVTPFAKVAYTDGTYSTPSKVTTHVQRLLDNAVSNVVNNSGVNIYPNPVTNNQVSIDLPAMSSAWSYELIDINGRTVAIGALPTTGNHAQLSLPAGAAPGIYNIRLNNNGTQYCVRSIDIEK